MPIVSVSGIRGIMNQDLDASLVESIGIRFGTFVNSGTVALGCDTRTTSIALKAAMSSGLVQAGCYVYDLGFSSTPSVFKEVSVRNLDGGIIVTASHNPPKWNGIKFVVKGGRGVFENELDAIKRESPNAVLQQGKVFRKKPLSLDILPEKAGFKTASGIKVALDLAGGVGSLFITSIIAYQGCEVHTLHDSPGIFPRIIDPTAD